MRCVLAEGLRIRSTIDLPAGDPVPTEQWEMWEAQSSVRLGLLDRLPVPWDVRLAMNVLGEGDAPGAGAR